MKEFAAILKDFGFSQKEASVYLATLALGEASVTDIAQKAKLPRTTCYEIIKSLTLRHMVSYFSARGRRVYVAESPAKIISFWEHRASTLKDLLPKLQAIEGRASARPTIRFYEGEEGLKTILDEVIEEKRNFDAITSIDDAFHLLEGDFAEFIELRKKRYLHVRLLTHKSKQSHDMRGRDSSELRETRFVPARYKFKTANFIFGDKIALLSLGEEHPVGLIVTDKSLADTFRMYFELLWNSAERN
ncbi:MAG: helix-turn-helix domain-containing protein [Candidatus Spechtbacterales bacterium]